MGSGSEVQRNPWVILVSVGLGLFMVIIDVSILNVALPTLSQDLHASMAEIEWTLIGYTIFMTGLVPFFGRISDVVGRKRLFILGLLVFALASLLAAQSHTILWLIGARLVQAIGGAMISSNVLAILTDTFPPGKRGVAMGVQSILISGGAAVGPSLGGFLVTRFGWESVFYVNLPIGLASAALALRILPPLQSNRTLEPVDWVGAATLLLGLTTLLLGATKGPAWGWTTGPVLALFVCGLALLSFFVYWELHSRYPLVDLSLFSIREFSAAQLAGLFTTLAMASMMFLFPFYWQGLRGFSAQQAGLLMLPVPLTLMVVAPLAGRLSDSVGARSLSSSGLLLVITGLFLMSRLTADMAIWDVVWRVMIFGAGLGMFMPPNHNAIMSAVPPHKRGISAGLLGMFRYSGQSLGVAFGGTIFTHVLGSSESVAAEGMPSHEFMAALSANPAALAAFQFTFMEAMHAVILAAIPLAAVGVVLSLMRTGHTRPPLLRESGSD